MSGSKNLVILVHVVLVQTWMNSRYIGALASVMDRCILLHQLLVEEGSGQQTAVLKAAASRLFKLLGAVASSTC